MGAVIAHRQLDTPRCATHPSNEEKLSINKTMTMDVYKYAAGDAKPGKTAKDTKREKRLERNRESARKCRKKRKQFVGDLQSQVETLGEENAMLQIENQRLMDLIQQLQSGRGYESNDVDPCPESTRKRARSEFGVSMANDFSESAVHATNSQQLEDFSKLAILTTFLLYSATLMQLTLTHAPTVLTQLASQAAALVPAVPPARASSATRAGLPARSSPIPCPP